MENTNEIKRNIFDLYDNARILFNDYYNGFSHNYTEQDKKLIKALLSIIESDIKEIKDNL